METKKTRNETIYLETQKWHRKEQDRPVLVHDTIVTLIHSCDIRSAQIKHTDHL